MAFARSLGISKPTALPHLIAEGIIPHNPTHSDYFWQREGISGEAQGDELLVTNTCVVWTRHGVIQQILDFTVEKENITQALFADFPYGSIEQASLQTGQKKENKDISYADADRLFNIRKRPSSKSGGKQSDLKSLTARVLNDVKSSQVNRRAIVVLLKTQAHIHFLSGTSHVVHIPFEPKKAFSTPYGLVIQRAQASKAITSSFETVKTPTNTFAFPRDSHGSVDKLPNLLKSENEDPLFASLYKRFVASSPQAKQNKLPHHI
jgi:anaphase-promoting complex subunit 1